MYKSVHVLKKTNNFCCVWIFWICACVCMGICICKCKCGCINVYL